MPTANRARLLRLLQSVVCASLLLGGGSGAGAQGAETFYKGKTLFIYIGFAPGGSYDYFGRLLARHLGQHLRGNPSVVAESMPGAGSFTAANFLSPAHRVMALRSGSSARP
jgi:tripartite-type tricarboxylate transporter receptor subunit TctC